jgi:hypothetical protein
MDIAVFDVFHDSNMVISSPAIVPVEKDNVARLWIATSVYPLIAGFKPCYGVNAVENFGMIPLWMYPHWSATQLTKQAHHGT